MQKSNEEKQNKFFSLLLVGSGLFVVPALTLYLSTLASITLENFTYLANQPSSKLVFISWAIISIITHLGLLLNLYTNLKIKQKSLLYLTFITLFISTIIPYPKGDSLLGFLHVASGYLAFILYNYALLQLYIHAQTIYSKLYTTILNIYLIMFGVCFCIFMYYGSINGLCEVIYCCVTIILLTVLKIKTA